MPGCLLLVGCLLLGPRQVQAEPALASAARWPAARMAHDLVYHARLGQVLLVGGTPADPGLWGWDGTRWTLLATGGPCDRYHFALAYDAHRDRLLLHGGARGVGDGAELFGDTWAWDGTTWTQVATQGPARDHHAMAYDPARRQVVLFGGGHGAEPSFHGDTWLWNGERWTEAEVAGPPARASHRLTADAARGRLVLYGGFGNDDALLGDTWEWDGAAWHEASGWGPGALAFPRTAWDEERALTLLFGGSNPPFQHKAHTWTWDGEVWQERAVSGPPARSMHALAYDPGRERVVLFGGLGGSGALADLWEWDGARWTEVARP